MTHRFNGIETKVLNIKETYTPTAPPSGKHKIYAKSDNRLWTLDSASNELRLINPENSSTGLLTGGIISVDTPGVSTTFNVASGTGIIVTLSAPTPATTGVESYTKTEVSWDTMSGIAISGGIGSRPITYVAIDSSGSVVQSGVSWTNTQRRLYIPIGVVVHPNLTTIELAAPAVVFEMSPGLQVADMARAIGYLNTSGNVMNHTGSGLTIQKSAGTTYALNSRYQSTPNDPSTIINNAIDTSATGTFRYSFQDSTSSAPTLTDIDPDLFDNGTFPGDLTGISANRWSVTRVFLALDNSLILAPPQSGDAGEYKTANEAINAVETEGFVVNGDLIANSVLIGYIAIRGGATNLSIESDAIFYAAGKFGGAVSGGSSSIDLQTTYDNSTSPQIVTDSTRGALVIQVGSGNDTDNLITGLNQTSDVTFSVSGIGNVLVGGVLKVGENHIEINHGYTTTSEKNGGLVVNYLPIATTDTVNGNFTAGVAATSNPTVITTGSGTFANDAFIQIHNAAESDNNGIFEVLSHTGTTLTVRGVGTSDVLNEFSQNQFTTDTSTPAGNITAVNISVLTSNTGGIWATGKDNDASTFTLNNLVDVTSAVQTAITGTGTLTSLDISGATTTASYIQFADMSAPSNPSNGEGRLYKKTGDDGIFWKPDVAGAEIDLTTTTLQNVYNDSTQPQITTTDVDGSVQIQRGTTGGNADLVFEVLNGAGTTVVSVSGEGNIVSNGIVADSLDANTATTLVIGASTATKVELADAGVLTEIQGSLTVQEDLVVNGTTTSINTVNVNVEDNYIYSNNGYEIVSAITGGAVVNYEPLATNDTVAATGFVAGVASTTNPQVSTTAASVFSDGDIIQITGANNPSNNGIFEVYVHAANVLEIRGIGANGHTANGDTPTHQFFQSDFVTDTTVAGTIRHITVGVMRIGTDGVWEVGSGSTSAFTYNDVIDTTTAGEANTASSAGGTSLVLAKSGVDLPFKGLTATSTKIGLTANANNIGIDVNQANITGTGNLDSGSITSNFGNIDNGSSSITTTGTITGGTTLVSDATASISKDTGALIVQNGGMGVEGDVYVGGSVNATSFQAEDPTSDTVLIGTTLSGTGALTMGTTGQVTTINGLVSFTSPLKQVITVVSHTGTLNPALADLNAVTSFTGAGTLNYTLPDMTSAQDGCTLMFINNSSFSKTITANTDNPDTIDGNANIVMEDEHDRITMMYHFAQLRWYIV